MKSLLHNLTLLFRYITDTQKPVIFELHYSKHIVDNHDLMLLTWVLGNKYNVSVEGNKTKYFSKCGSAMIPMPVKGDSVKISINNLWRRKQIFVPIIKTFVDANSNKPLKNYFTLIGQPVTTRSFTMQPAVEKTEPLERPMPAAAAMPSILSNAGELKYDHA